MSGTKPNKYTVRSARPSRCDQLRQNLSSSWSSSSSPSSESSDAGRLSRSEADLRKLLRLDPTRRQQPGRNDTGKCVISADQAVHYCGFTEEVTAPIIPPTKQGQCHVSQKSGREICFPSYEQLDTTCTDPAPAEQQSPGPVPPPVIKHATVRAMAFVAPDDLQRLIKQYYRQNQQPIPKDLNYDLKPYLFARYRCDYGYELIDEVDTVFCSGRQWIQSLPECRGKGPCAVDNGGCSHSCISPDNTTVECRCPKGLVLDVDDKTCIKPAPKNECKNLQGCVCESINDLQLSCTCRPSGNKCLLQKGPPKIFLHPPPPYQNEPGSSVNITCSGVGYPFPDTIWTSNDDQPFGQQKDPNAAYNAQMSVTDVVKNGQFTCTSTNKHGQAEKVADIVVAGPDATHLEKVDSDRTSVEVHWIPPDHVNRPITHYTIYYTNNPQQPVKNWKSVDVNEPNRNVVIEDLRSDTEYTFRVRANDNLGPGKLSNAVSAKTQEAAKRPAVEIVEGEELRIAPNEPFTLNCNVIRGDPTPVIVWESKGRSISNPQEGRSIALQHKGLLEETSFLCVAENEAGKTSKRIHVVVTGPTAPERIRTNVDGDDIGLQWEPPRITNGPMEDYEILYTDDPSLPEDQWQTTNSDGKTSALIPDLKELTDYTFRVKGKNANGVGLPSKDYNVTTWLKPRPPQITLKPEGDVEVKPSADELVIECEATGVPKPKIAWFWDDQLVSDGENDFRVYDVSKMDALNVTNSKLIARSTTKTGKARCEAVNKEGSDEKEINVKVLGPGTPPKDIHPQPEENGIKVEWTEPDVPNGNIKEYVVHYSKDPDSPLDEWQQVVVPADKTVAVIEDREEDTPYVVRIQAKTDDGPGIISEPYEVTTGKKHIPLTTKLEILDPAYTPGEDLVVEPGQKIKFRCITEGRPTPSLSYNWLPLDSTESGEEPIHIRTNPAPDAEHTYQSDETETQTFTKRRLVCQGRNPDGVKDDSVTFDVKKPGSPPVTIDPDVDVDNKVTIKWKPPVHPNGDITGYKVYLSADPSKPLDQWQTFDVPASEDPQIQFGRGELEPDTPYHVQVSAVNPDGEGVKSDPVPFQTQSGAPIDAPTDVLASVAPDNSVNISWTGPSQPNGPIQSYTVYLTPADPSTNDDNYKSWPKISVPSTEDIGNITLDKDEYQILPNKEYRVRVTATNDQSEGPASETISFNTGTGEIVPTIKLSPSDNPTKVDPLGDLTVTCTADGIPDPTVYWVIDGEKTNSNVLQLTGLVKDKVVECKAVNNAGEATEPLRIEVQGPGTPPVISSIQALPDQEIQVEWNAPDEPNGQITNYIVKYGEIPEGETSPTSWEEITVPGNQGEASIKGLKPKTTYYVKVQAISDRGPGVESDTQRAKTLPITPPPPNVSKVDVHPNNTVAILFDAVPDPENPETKIKNYKIHYTSDDPLTEGTEWKEMTWTHPDDSPTVAIPIDGENFEPNKKYNIKITPEGEITGTSSDPMPFETGSGIIAPEKPTFNVDAPDNTIKVPAGTDYSVTCISDGRPPPKFTWVDSEGNVVSEGPVLSVNDVKTTKNFKCRAENTGGSEETDFQIYVAGPGDAPEITNMHAHKPRTIEVRWDPPKIPNGEITRYIIYYTPLDDQDPGKQVGQVPSKPVSEWLTHHVTGEKVNEGDKEATIKDYIDPDTSYAFVIQAVNDDGPGPYSVQQNIRTMSRAQEGPPTDLRVEPIDQNSAEIDWKRPENVEEDPIGYEIFYVPANKEIEIDEFDSLPKWTKLSVDDGNAESYVLNDGLQPDTEYVFKIRAIYPKGPGVFSEPCISRTLPEGNAPVITVSSGGEGTEGTTKIALLPGSSLLVFCNATGSPSPSVNWIRQGSIPIDPSTVKNEGYATRWSLNVNNITEDTTFNCVAQNPLGKANWTIDLDIVEELPENWKNSLIKAKKDGDDVVLDVNDKAKESLQDPKEWTLKLTDDPSKPKDEWRTIESNGRPLDDIRVDDTLPGKPYYVTVTDPNTGLESPILSFVTPKPAEIVNVGANIDDDIVVDFKPAVGPSDVENYEIKSWPSNDPSNVRTQQVDPTKLNGNVIPDLAPDTDYNFQVVTNFKDGSNLEGDPMSTKTPPQDVKCDCSHACRLEKDEEGKAKVKCYCPQGFELEEDEKTCKKVADTETKQIVVEVTPAYDDKTNRFDDLSQQHSIDGSPLPTNEYGKPIYLEDDITSQPLPTDSLGRVIRPIVRVDGSRLPVDGDGNTLNQLSQVIEKNDEGQPLGPDNEILTKNLNGDWLYPEIDNHGHALPFDKNGKHVYPIIGSDGNILRTNDDGQRIDRNGEPIPTNPYGRPIGPDGSPLPTDAEQNYRWNDDVDDITDEPFPTDIIGHIVYPIVDQHGKLLPLNEEGHHVDDNGVEIPTNEYGFPVHPQTADILPKNSQGQYILSDGKEETPTPEADDQERGQDVTPTERHAPIYDTNGDVLPTNYDGDYLDRTGNTIQTDSLGRPLNAHGQVLPTNADGNYVLQDVAPTNSDGGKVNVVDFQGRPLPTDQSGRPLAENGSPIEVKEGQYVDEDGNPLPTDSAGNAVFGTPDTSEEAAKDLEFPIVDANGYPLPKDEHGRFIDSRGEPFRKDDDNKPLGLDGQVLPNDSSGNYIYTPEKKPTNFAGDPVVVKGADHQPVPLDQQDRPLDTNGDPLLIRDGQYMNKDGNPLPLDPDGNAMLLPVDDSGKFIYPVTDVDGNTLPTDSSGHYVDPDGQTIPTDDSGKPVDNTGKILPTDSTGSFIYSKPKPIDSSGKEVTPVGPDGLPLSKDNEGNYVKADGSPVPINENNEYTDSQGSPLPIDPYGRVVIRPDDELQTTEYVPTEKPIVPPTDAAGNPIVVVDKDGSPLPTNSDGIHLNEEGNPIPTNAENQYVNEDGSLLPVDPEGRVHLVNPEDFTETAEATDAYGKVVYPIVDVDGELLPKDESGRHVDKKGELVPVNDFGKPLGPDGTPLAQNDKGQYVLPSDVHPDTEADQPIPTDDRGEEDVHGPEKELEVTELPTAAIGNKPTDESGKPVIVVNSDGIPLPTDAEGGYVDPQGQPVPTNSDNQYVGPDGSPLPTDQYNNVIMPSGDEVVGKTLPTDSYGKQVYPVVDSDGTLLPTDETGRHVGPNGEPIPVDDFGRPTRPDGSLLPQDSDGRYVNQPPANLPTDSSGKPLVVIGPDGAPLQKDSEGNYVQPDGAPVPTSSDHEYVGPDGEPLPTNSDGQVVLSAEDATGKTLPTDSYGRQVYPVVDPQGNLLPTDETGRHTGPNNEPIQVDDSGRPLKPDGSLFRENDAGQYVFEPALGPTSASGNPIVVVGPDGQPLQKNDQGQYIKPDGQPIPTNAANEYVAPDGSPLPTNVDGTVILQSDQEPAPQTLPTDETGREVYPVVDADNRPLPTDDSGRYLSPDGELIPIDELGRPMSSDGTVLPQNDKGHYIMSSDKAGTLLPSELPDQDHTADSYLTSTAIVRPTDRDGNPAVIVGPDGNPLPKNDNGDYIMEDGSPVPTNADLQYVDPQGSVLPVDPEGQFVWNAGEDDTPKTLPTDDSGREIHPVVNPQGVPWPTDVTGRHVDHQGELIPVDDYGRPIGPDGTVLPTNEEGHYVFKPDVKPTDPTGREIIVVGPDGTPLTTDDKGKFIDKDNQPIPTNAANEYVGPDGSPLPTTSEGNVIFGADSLPEVKTLPTDDTGKLIYPIVNPDGSPVSTDSTQRYVDDSGELIPVDESGRPLDKDGQLLPTDATGNYIFRSDDTPQTPHSSTQEVGPDGQPVVTELPTDSTGGRPTDESGKPVIVVNSDGIPLPTDAEGGYVDPQGQPVPTNSDNQYVGPDGSPLPTDQYNNVIMPSGDEVVGKTLPTDSYGKQVYPVVDSDGTLLPTDETGRHVGPNGEPIPVDDFGRPTRPDGSLLPQDSDGRYVNQPPANLPTDSSGKPLVVIGPDGAPLQKDSEGNYVQPDGALVPTSSDHEYVGPDGEPLPTNSDGQVVLSAEDATGKTLPTDSYGRQVYPVVDPQGNLLPTDETGRHIGPNNEPIQVDDSGKPTNADGTLLPRDSEGRYVFTPIVGPTDSTGRPIIAVGPDGTPLSKNTEGKYVDPDGVPVPTNSANEFVGPDGSPLPTNAEGQVVIGADSEVEPKTLPTDDTGKDVHPVIDVNGDLLPTDSSGRHVKPDGQLLETDDYGRPLKEDGTLLPTDSAGNYIYTAETPKVVDDQGKPVVVVGADGLPLETNSDGQFVGPDGTPVKVENNHYVNADGEILPTNENGQVVLSPEKELEPKVLPTDKAGTVVYPIVDKNSHPLPKNAEGRFINKEGELIPLDEFSRPLGPDGTPLPKNENGKYVHPDSFPARPTDATGNVIPVVGKDGQPLPIDSEGNYVGPDNEPIKVNDELKYVDDSGNLLPINENGEAIYDSSAKTLPTDDSGRKIYPIVSADGLPLPTDYTGHYTDDRGDIIPLDDYGRPLSPDGSLLPQNEQGQYVHGEDTVVSTKPTDPSGNPVTVVDGNGSPLPTDSAGNYIYSDGSPIPTNSANQYVGPDGSPLPFNPEGQVVVGAVTEPEGRTLPTDDTGKVVYPIVRPDGSLLPTDSTGRYIDRYGEQIPVNDFGKPINKNTGEVLPTDNYDQYIFHDGKPSHSSGLPISVVDKAGNLLPTDETGNFVLDDGSPIPTNDQLQYLGPDGSPLPFNEENKAVHPGAEEKETVLPTDEDGKFLYPIVRPDGTPLETDSSGRYLDNRGEPIPIDDFGRPLGKDKQLLPRLNDKTFVYSGGVILPTDSTGTLIKVVDPDGQPLPTSIDGLYVGKDGNVIPTDDDNNYIGSDGVLLPVDEGKIVYKDETSAVSDKSGRVPLPVVDENGTLRPTNPTGLYVDFNNVPLEVDEYGIPHYADGTPLKQDDNGNYVYQDQRAKESKHCYVDRYIEMILVVDTSENTKILEYRLMKETIKSFLKENFDLGENKVRLGLIKYGSQVDVPVALGDYSNAGELLSRIGDARRLKGSAQLGEALRDTVSEFKISGAKDSAKVVIVFKGGKSADDVELPSTELRNNGAHVFVVTAGEVDSDNVLITGDEENVFRFKDWKSLEPSHLGPIADKICALTPESQSAPTAWPIRPTRPATTGQTRECSTVEYEVDLVVLLDSSKFTQEEFTTTLESVGTLVDESFDLAPDVVRVGFIVYSDKVSVPVALGHYEDKIELLEKIQESELVEGTAIALKGLDAARQQFRLHGRGGVAKVVLMITNGNYRGNGQQFAQELRDTHDIQLFVLGINPSQARLPSLQRLVGVEYAKERLLTINNIDDISSKIDFIRSSLCGRISQTTVGGDDYDTTMSHRTTKRDVTKIPLSEQKEPCDEKGKMTVNIVIDSNGGAQDQQEIDNVKFVVQTFLDEKYADDEPAKKPLVNLININSQDKTILHSRSGVPVDNLYNEMSDIFDEAVKENEAIREKLPNCQH
ncbi:unnamed protein product [Bursaphelenchus okinawaensis]|uniref:Mesocentin n=1 Tax=Bursaphelenchus okinawaensis TaxID=465554 RepID=A0A811KKR9_9BILA|nr:unnamed protein product [Bursaphelenchus okinawaensis]CAG9104570.1 unnamed protein product [Bursaphelenchus okinawaensis]